MKCLTEKGKKTMGRFIDIDKLVLPKDTVKKIQKKGIPAILDWLAEQESIEVIRCKDCKYHKGLNCPIMKYKFTHDNDYCSYAERKKE